MSKLPQTGLPLIIIDSDQAEITSLQSQLKEAEEALEGFTQPTKEMVLLNQERLSFKNKLAIAVEALEDAEQTICDHLPIEGCTCHITPPCSSCINGPEQVKHIRETLAKIKGDE